MKPSKKKQISQHAKSSFDYIHILYGLMIIAYILIPTFTPNLMALDTNAPKFLTTAILNFVVFIVLISFKRERVDVVFHGNFFRTNVGLVYASFLFIVLLSFVKSINVMESVLQLAKVVTVFMAVFNLSVLLNRDLRNIKLIAVIMMGLLLFDAVSVFYYINKFINGEIAAITDIKTVYSNKNILASAIFVKLPFALWLLVFEKAWLKKLAWIALMAGMAATFFLATRAFYLGLFLISAIFLTYYIVVFLRTRKKELLWFAGSYLSAIAISLLIFSLTQNFLYPGNKTVATANSIPQDNETAVGLERHTQGVIGQVASIKGTDASAGLRLDAWKWSWQLIKENPLFGVGAGNWKVAILKLENQKNDAYIYIYKAHNDFIETTAETGLIGGLLFLSIFFLVLYNFIRYYTKNQDNSDILLRSFYLSAAGLVFYGVDAMFNFPADRPEILILFAVFVATAIVAANQAKHQLMGSAVITVTTQNPGLNLLKWIGSILCLGLMTGIIYFHYQNFLSIKTQRIAFQEILSGKLKGPSEKIIKGFPSFPNVSIWGEPISSIKARYLINESKYQEAINCVKNDFTSPYDSRREFYMATAYRSLNKPDSAMLYSQLTYQLKPNYLRNIVVMAELLEQKGEFSKASELMENQLKKNKSPLQAYIMASNLFVKSGKIDKAQSIIEEAMVNFPGDTSLVKQKRFINYKLSIEPHIALYNEAKVLFDNKNYSKSLTLLTDFLHKVPNDSNALIMKAFAIYYLKNYDDCIIAINEALAVNNKNASLINLRGVCNRMLNHADEACIDFKMAMEMGNQSGITNYGRYCVTK
jgi:tetratricopeptide (TPR) repeat protein